jgi:hypothetical protein
MRGLIRILGSMSHRFCRVRCWGDAWECEYDGPITMQPVDFIAFVLTDLLPLPLCVL